MDTMTANQELWNLIHSAPVVVFRSKITNIGGLEDILDANGIEWHDVEVQITGEENRERFNALRRITGRASMPQIFINGEFIGGAAEAQAVLQTRSLPVPAPVPVIALLLGYASLIPYFAFTARLWWQPTGPAILLLTVFSALAITFFGAIHWGLALAGRAPPARYFWSIQPALLAWALVALHHRAALPLLAALLVIVWLVEREETGDELPIWYQRMHSHLTFGFTLSLLLAWLALLFRL